MACLLLLCLLLHLLNNVDNQSICFDSKHKSNRNWYFVGPFPEECPTGCGVVKNVTISGGTNGFFTWQSQVWTLPQLMFGLRYHVGGSYCAMEQHDDKMLMCCYANEKFVLNGTNNCTNWGDVQVIFVCVPVQQFRIANGTTKDNQIFILVGNTNCTLATYMVNGSSYIISLMSTVLNGPEIKCGGLQSQLNNQVVNLKGGYHKSLGLNYSDPLRLGGQCGRLGCLNESLTGIFCSKEGDEKFVSRVKTYANSTKFWNETGTILCPLGHSEACRKNGECMCVAPVFNRASIATPLFTTFLTLFTLSDGAEGDTTTKAKTTSKMGLHEVSCNNSSLNLTCYQYNQSCHMMCDGRQCGMGESCPWWCDGKFNQTGMCDHLCWRNSNNYVHCVQLWWNPFDRMMGWVENLLILEQAMLVLALFGALCWMWYYQWWKTIFWAIKAFFCCQPRGPIFRKQIRNKGFRSSFKLNGVTFSTRNCVLMGLLCVLSFGCVRPTRGINIGPEDHGRPFYNGTLALTVQRAYDWYNLTSHGGEQACMKYKKVFTISNQCNHHSTPSTGKCDVPGLTSDCKYKEDPTVCGRAVIYGGGWATGCFYFWQNPLAGGCGCYCEKPINRYYLTQKSNSTFLVQLHYQGNTTAFWFNNTGTHTVKVGETFINLTISGCVGSPPTQMGFFLDKQTPPIDVGKCAHFKNGWLKDGCPVRLWYGYNAGHGDCDGPKHCPLDFMRLSGKRTKHSWEQYLTCDYNFQWMEGKCEPNSQGTVIGCVSGSTCLVQFNNCTKCCYNGYTIITHSTYIFPCTQCTWNGTKYNGSMLSYYGADYNDGVTLIKSNAGDIWDFLNTLWNAFWGWLPGIGWTKYLWYIGIILCGLMIFYCCCKK